MLPVERRDPVERNHIHLVVEVAVRRSGDNDELLVVAFEKLESVFAEVAAVRLFAVDDHHRALYFARVCKQFRVYERKKRRLVPSTVRVERPPVVAARRLVVVVVVLDELRRVGGERIDGIVYEVDD